MFVFKGLPSESSNSSLFPIFFFPPFLPLFFPPSFERWAKRVGFSSIHCLVACLREGPAGGEGGREGGGAGGG